MPDELHDIIIIGSGPAGLTAAIYCARADLNPIVIPGMQQGGQLTITTTVENYPGFPHGIQGPELMLNFQTQAERFGAKILRGEVTSVDFSKKPLEINMEGEILKAKAVIICTGASARTMDLPAIPKLIGYGISTCATCDGFFFRNKEVMIIGGGDSAMEEADFLTKFATKVYVVHRREELRASKIMQQRAFDNPKIEFIWNTVIADVSDPNKQKVESALLKNVKTGETHHKPIDGIFFAIGHDPNTQLFKNQLELDSKGYIRTTRRTMTSVEGVFAAGDVTDTLYKQCITAAGMGCQAALDAQHFLMGTFYH